MKSKFRSFGKLLFFIAILSVFIILSIGCQKSSNTPTTTTSGQGANEVWMQNTAFNPSSITVAVNTTVKWTNKDAMAHTVTSTTGIFDSGNIGAGSTYSRQFTVAGTYPYKCTIHANMTGTVFVQ